SDTAGIFSNSKMVASSTTTNDGGAAILQETLNDIYSAKFDTLPDQDGTKVRSLSFGDRVRLDDDYAVPEYNTDLEDLEITKPQVVAKGEEVLVGEDYTRGGEEGGVYRYIGTTPISIDLSTENYSVTSRWLKVGGTAGSVYQYMGGTSANLDLTKADFTDYDYWKLVPESHVIPEGFNVSASDATAVGFIFVFNQVDAASEAYVDHTKVTAAAGDISIDVVEDATIKAKSDSAGEASGGSAWGTGSTLVVNGVIVTNVVKSSAKAYVADNADLTATVGDILIDATNTSLIDATNLSATTSSGQAVGITLAFNSIGWNAQNFLFNTVDTLLGDPVISAAMGGANPSQTSAYVENSDLTAGDDIAITATSTAEIKSEVSNKATSAAAALINDDGLAVGGIISSNMVNANTKAYIDNVPNSGKSIDADGTLSVRADDEAKINADIKLIAQSTSSNDGGLSVALDLIKSLVQDYPYTTKSGTQTVKNGDYVRMAHDYANADGEGAIYQYQPKDAQGNRTQTPFTGDLGAINYKTDTNWVRVTGSTIDDIIESKAFMQALTSISASDSAAVGGSISRNDVRGGAEATIKEAVVTGDQGIVVAANEAAVIIAATTSSVTSSGGSVFRGGGSSKALN
ncbi:MAG: hypothetical protein EOO74_05365, partial [Myxococcales bacterium]